MSKAKPIRHNKPAIKGLHEKMAQITGQGTLTGIPGFTDYTVLRLVSEIGTDLTKLKTEKHFTSWLRLIPGQKHSGKMKRRYTYKHAPVASVIFRQQAQSLLNSKNHSLGAFGRRIRAKRGPGIAVKAVARKLAELYYRAMTQGMAYVEQGVVAYENQYKEMRLHYLKKQATNLGFELRELKT